MDKLAFGAVMAGAGLPTLPRVALDARTDDRRLRRARSSSSPASGARPSASRWWPTCATARARLGANLHLRAGAVVEPYRPEFFDLQIGVRAGPTLAAVGHRAAAADPPGRRSGRWPEILGLRRQVRRRRGHGQRPAGAPGRDRPDAGGDAPARRPSRWPAWPRVRGVARIDFLSDGDELVVNEVNTIPGSLARYLWIDPAVPFGTLLADLVAEARGRPTHVYSAAGADGVVLRGASSIAAKLA